MTKNAMLKILASRVKECGGVCAYARQIGILHQEVSHALRGKRRPAPAILADLGLIAVKTVTYERVVDARDHILEEQSKKVKSLRLRLEQENALLGQIKGMKNQDDQVAT